MASTVSSSFPLQEIYPQREYGKNKKQIPHYLIGWNRDPKTICEYIDKHPELLETRDHNGLTPFAVACMAGNARMAGELLKRGATPLTLDCHKWTSLHYSFLNNDKPMAELIERAARAQKTALPSLEALKRTLTPPLPARRDCRVGLLQLADGSLAPLSQAHFAQMTGGAKIKQEPFATRESLVDFWMRGPIPAERHPVELPFVEILSREYRKYRAEGHKDWFALRPAGRGSFRVLAAQDIPEGQVIGVHGGKIAPRALADTDASDEHRFDELDASEVRNPVSMIRDGLPNCTVQTHFEDGLFHYLLIPIRPIRKGEELLIDFGPTHSAKFAYRKFPEETLRFYEENPPLAIWNRFRAIDPKRKSGLLEMEGLRTQIRYFFSTTHLFLQLLRENRIDRAEIKALLGDPLAEKVLELNPGAVAAYNAIIEGWDALEAHFERISPELKEQILENLFLFIRTQSVQLIVQCFYELPHHLPQARDQASWAQVFTILNENAMGHEILFDWLKGEATDREALQAYLAIHPISRIGFHITLSAVADKKFPEKHKPLRMLRARAAIHEWLRRSTLGRESLAAISALEFDELEEFTQSMLPHLAHKHPDRVDPFRRLMNAFLQAPQSGERKDSTSASPEPISSRA